jgi:hypothetical protein
VRDVRLALQTGGGDHRKETPFRPENPVNRSREIALLPD